MNTKPFYIGITILIAGLLLGLIGWAIYIGQQKQDLESGTKDVGYLNDLTRGVTGSGIFGGVFTDEEDIKDSEVDIPKAVLKQLYNLPIAGYYKREENSILFVDRATGHVFEQDLETNVSKRINQATVPKVYNSIFVNDGEAVVRQSIHEDGDVLTIFSLSKDGSSNTSIPFLTSIEAGQGSDFAFIEKTSTVSSLGIFDVDKETRTILFESELKNWSLQWRGNSILMTQNPSFFLLTSAMLVNSSTGSREVVISQKKGLITNLSPDAKQILFSVIENNRPVLYIRNIESGEETSLNVSGFADKCAWIESSVICALPNSLPEGSYPDIWYTGEVSFSDSFWKIDTKDLILSKIISPESELGISMDAINLLVNDNVLFFKNKTDQTLWSLII
ncbi:hypothetical protein COB52_03135 [Candidatus Kaiserbacteria bacterium]|nr:MAG: hypothetical protein COB52_03135 [Candidatus Kaiserbacteria bacterium]